MENLYQNAQSQHISWLKLAVAVAMLRRKPAEMTARKYVENIQAEYLLSQSLLQDQYHQAKMQIMHLQQKLMLSSSSQSRTVPDNMKVSQQLTDDADQQSNGRCENTLEQETMTGADNSLLAAYRVADGCIDVCMLENYKFMHSVIELQGLARQGPDLETECLLGAAVTHIKTLRTVIDRDVMILTEMCMCKGAESVTMLTDSIPWIGDQPEFMQEVCLLVECIINKLVQPSSCGQGQVLRQKKALMNMLLVFMKGNKVPLLSSLLESLVEYMETFCQKLKTSHQISVAIDPDLFENSYFIVHCLELTMKLWSKECHIHMSVLQEAQTKLDRSLMQLTHCFPLVAQALLRITSLIEAIIQNR